MKRISILLSGLVLSAAVTLPAFAGTVYSQSANGVNAWTSESAGNAGFNQAFDDFTLVGGGSFTGVSWTGWVYPPESEITSFTISIYSSNAGAPSALGSPLATYAITGDANETVIAYSGSGYAIATFSATIPVFTATDSVTYWISITAAVNGGVYKWALSDHGDGSFANYDGSDLSAIGDQQNPADLAFTLSNPSTVPEPCALLLTGTGLLGSFGLLRRRFTQR